MNGGLPDSIVRELVDSHGAHTILLYGSRADGSAGPDSDWDIAAFADVPRTLRVTRPLGGTFLDVFIHPEGELDAPTQEHLKLDGAIVVAEREGSGTRIIDKVAAIIERGPEPLPPDELQARRDWAYKMLDRMARGDAEGDYRRAWLLTMLLEDYFHLRGLWYRGPKKSLAWLAAHDTGAHVAFVAALKPGARDDAIRRLVEAVVRRQTG